MSDDIQAFLQYLFAIEILGLAVWPLARRLFQTFPDKGWGLSKALGLLVVSWLVWILGSLKIAPFTLATVAGAAATIAFVSWLPLLQQPRRWLRLLRLPRLVIFEELVFITAFALWAYIRGFSPDIHGLEKFMDYGFMLSILRWEYFPPLDHFLAGETINYYYFGHFMAALLSRLSQVPANIAYNLQIALLYGLTVLGSFSLGFALFARRVKEGSKEWLSYLAGLLAALFTISIGNLHTVSNLRDLSNYWYPAATRLIPNTINEFPLYSFVVADLHGHVSNLPIALLILGLLVAYIFSQKRQIPSTPEVETSFHFRAGKLQTNPESVLNFEFWIFLSLATGAAFATNSWDFPIYWGLIGLVMLVFNWQQQQSVSRAVTGTAKKLAPILALSIILFLPYWLTVKPNTGGIGLVAFVDSFNPADFAAFKDLPLPLYLFKRFIIRSPLSLLLQLWGFYAILAAGFVVWLLRGRLSLPGRTGVVQGLARLLGVSAKIKGKGKAQRVSFLGHLRSLREGNFIAFSLIVYGFALILLPEWIYLDDIYKPDYYRANTLFKFYYAAWVFLALATSYAIVKIAVWAHQSKSFLGRLFVIIFALVLLPSVLLYTRFALDSSTGGALKTYKSLNGTNWLSTAYPADAEAIDFLNQEIKGQPVILEAVGDSYTDYARISANTGLPTVMGWPVHEWLWRGSYSNPIRPITRVQKETGQPDTVGKRVEEVRQIYESIDLELTQNLLNKYQVSYIYLGSLEKEKYPNLQAEKFDQLGELIYQNPGVKIYQVYSAD